jgi:hypothetical protein
VSCTSCVASRAEVDEEEMMAYLTDDGYDDPYYNHEFFGGLNPWQDVNADF